MADTKEITCSINGKEYKFPEGTSLESFLESRNIKSTSVVVEYNKDVLPRGTYEELILADGDSVEIVQLIGGG
jgi:thiamine biosynthesis protein ThiS